MEIELHGEILDHFHRLLEWINKNQRVSDSHLSRIKDRAITELHNDSNKWYHEKDLSELFNYCFWKTK